MLFQNEEASLKLDIVNYEFPADGGDPTSDDRNWLVLRCTWTDEDGNVVKDSNSCLLTYELREMTAGLKVLNAGIKDYYVSTFVEPYFEVSAQAEEDGFLSRAPAYQAGAFSASKSSATGKVAGKLVARRSVGG